MTDGNTAIQVSPVTEDEVSKLHDFVNRAADTIVQASTLAKEVAELRRVVDGLTSDVQRLRNQNDALDDQITRIREQRDTAMRERDTFHAEAIANAQERDNLRHIAEDRSRQITDLHAEVDRLTAELHRTQRAHDEAELHAMELEDKLQAMRDTFEKVFGMDKQPAPVHLTPTPEEPTQPVEATAASQDYHPAPVMSEAPYNPPHSAPEEAKPADPDEHKPYWLR